MPPAPSGSLRSSGPDGPGRGLPSRSSPRAGRGRRGGRPRGRRAVDPGRSRAPRCAARSRVADAGREARPRGHRHARRRDRRRRRGARRPARAGALVVHLSGACSLGARHAAGERPDVASARSTRSCRSRRRPRSGPARRGVVRGRRAARGRAPRARARHASVPRRRRATGPRTTPAACIASNHLVALLGQVERVATPRACRSRPSSRWCGPRVDNVAALGPAAALTGPVGAGRRRDGRPPPRRAAARRASRVRGAGRRGPRA